MSDIVPALKAELAALETDIRVNPDPRFGKIERIKELLRVYGALPKTVEPTPLERAIGASSSPMSNGQSVLPNFHGVGGKPLSKEDRVKSEIRTFLKVKQIAHRKEILNHLTETGTMGHEKDPMASLAAYLSGFMKDQTFVSDGNGNYSLKPG